MHQSTLQVNILKAAIAVAGFAVLGVSQPAKGQSVDVPDSWGGDVWSRPRLTGSWFGLRDELAKKGIVFDVDLLATPQYVVSGGRSTGGNTWGNTDYTLNLDTDKLGLWPGGFINISADTGLGNNITYQSGSIVPVNVASLVPAPADRTTALMNATVTQFFGTKFSIALGKFNTFISGEQEFYGDYSSQFLNAAFVFPMTLEQVPLSAYGGTVNYSPTDDAALSILVLDPNGTPTSNSFNDAFSNGAMVLGSAELTIKPLGLVGHQNLGISWSNKDRYSLTQDPSNIADVLLHTEFPRLGNPGPILQDILERFFPGLSPPTQPANRENRTWSVNYAFDQYLWQPKDDTKHGIGVFISAGVSDGNPNPIKYAFLAGVGGKGVPGRPDDGYGVGISRTQFSSAFIPFLRQSLGLGLDHEDALEAYYNLALTAWLSATADLQIIDPGLKRSLDSSGVGLMNIDTTTVAGLRLRVRF